MSTKKKIEKKEESLYSCPKPWTMFIIYLIMIVIMLAYAFIAALAYEYEQPIPPNFGREFVNSFQEDVLIPAASEMKAYLWSGIAMIILALIAIFFISIILLKKLPPKLHHDGQDDDTFGREWENKGIELDDIISEEGVQKIIYLSPK